MLSPRGKQLSRSIACLAALCLAVLVSPTASANPSDPAFPSQQAVQDAQQQVIQTQSSVTGIEAQLADADAQLQSLAVAADQASEAYDGAVYRWQQAQRAATAAQQRAHRAELAASKARSSLAGYVVSHDTSGGTLTALSSAMSAAGTTGLINQMADYSTTSSALDSHLQQWQAASRLAEVYRAQAKRALGAATAAKQAADAAKQAATDAVAQQQASVSSIEAQKSSLISQLAAAQHTSVRLAAQRAAGLERLRQERLAAARRAAARQARLEAQRQERLAEQRQEQRQEQRREERQREQQSNPGGGQSQGGGQQQGGGSGGSGSGGSGGGGYGGGSGSGSAATAIAFAYAQLGDPYVYGAAGPDAWDCSGLTMGSWAAAGVYLPHYSVAQYESIEHISFGELRPGDLVFWGSSSSPSSIYHVAIYIGGGKIIQAPHPGAYVEVSSLYDWILPNFFGRP